MKSFAVACFALIIVSFGFAPSHGIDDWNNLRITANERKINFQIDWSGAIIQNIDYPEWVEGEKDWKGSEAELRNKFIKSFNGITDNGDYPHRLGNYAEAPYSLILHIVNVNEDGSMIQAVVSVVDDHENTIFQKEHFSNKGHWGSTINLMGDALEEMGRSVGNNFYRYARPDKKERKKNYNDGIYSRKK